MATSEEFQGLRAGVAPERQSSSQQMVELAAEKGMTLMVDALKGLFKQMDEKEEFDALELDPIALAAMAGRSRGEQLNGDFP